MPTVATRDCPSAKPYRKVLSELLIPSGLLNCFSSVVVVVLDDCFGHYLAQGALRSLLLLIVLGEWLTSKMEVRRCLLMIQLARILRHCNGMSTAICLSGL